MQGREYIHIAPSILSADFGKLAEEAKRIERAGADAIHVDIMDGHFVPNLSFGHQVLSALDRATSLWMDVHLMVDRPEDYVDRLVKSGADSITFHVETVHDAEGLLSHIRSCGLEVGLAFCPETELCLTPALLEQCDQLLIMTVHPGFSGQRFLKGPLEKIKTAREMCCRLPIHRKRKTLSPKNASQASPFNIQVDGGIDEITAPLCIKAGANHLVSGSYLFDQGEKGDDLAYKLHKLRCCGDTFRRKRRSENNGD